MNTLSDPILVLFRRHVERMGNIDVNHTNLATYRELQQVGRSRKFSFEGSTFHD